MKKNKSIAENIDEEIKNEILQEDKKNNKIILITILIIVSCLLIAIPIGITLINNSKENKTDEKQSQENNANLNNNGQNTEKEDETSPQEPENYPHLDNNTNIDISQFSKTQKEVYDLYNKIYITEKDLYQKDIYTKDEMSTHDIVATALNLIDRKYIVSACESSKTRENVTFDYINNILKNNIENKNISMETLKEFAFNESYVGAQYFINQIEIKQVGNDIQLYGPCGVEYNGGDVTRKQLEKIEDQEEYVYVYEKHAFARPSDKFNDDSSFNFYKTYNRDGEIIETTNQEPNWSLYNTYKYIFRKHSNGYYFEKIEVIK